ncbi:MAG: alanine racemase [Gemmatimonadota bacterium]|nr:MAG: alanine racemase [Gemmatimonadota bacterium]
MREITRRGFLALTSTAPLALAVPEKLWGVSTSGPAISSERYDPWIEISLENLAWNLAQIRRRVGNRPVMAVIKANAYGHGLVGVAGFLERENVRHFAVGKVQEAALLRENGIGGTILNFGPFSRDEAEQLVELDISQSVYSDAVDMLAEAGRRQGQGAKVHIKVDTGLGRVGVPYHEALPFIEKVASLSGISIEGIFTTLTEEPEFDRVQLERFIQVCDAAEDAGISVGSRHAASSLAIATLPDSFLDMVRPGNAIYGLEPLANMDLKPVMSLKTRVVYVKRLRPGDSVSYHRRFTAERETLVATLPLGYSDGYPPQGVDQAEVLIRGQRWPLIAAVTANHATVDVTGAEEPQIGDEVVLFGNQDGARLSIGEVAGWAGSSVYRVAIGMNPLLPRIHLE